MSQKLNEAELANLLSAALDGELTPESQRALSALVSTDSAARRQYVNLMLLDTLLSEEFSKAAVRDAVDLLAGNDSAKSVVAPQAFAKTTSPLRKWTGYAIAAVLLLATAIGVSTLGTREVSAAALLAQSRRVHESPLDHCYVVEVSGWSGSIQQDRSTTFTRSLIANLLVHRVDRLWTRGDRFFIESSNATHRWVWGQDESGAAWLALNRRIGLQVEPDEMPGWLTTICELLSMRVDTLLEDVLRDFELTWEDSADPSIRIVKATPKSAKRSRWIREVILEVDLESKILQRVVLHRANAVDRVATVTYTLAKTEAQPDESYELTGHLEAPFAIFSRSHRPERRDEILTRLYMNGSGKAETESKTDTPSFQQPKGI